MTIDDLVDQEHLPWTRDRSGIWVELSDGGRRHRVAYRRFGDDYVFTSLVVAAAVVNRTARQRRALAFRTWRRNALKAVVTLAFDKRDHLMGIIEQPVVTMHDKELRFYVETLAQECDRYEYILTGGDRG